MTHPARPSQTLNGDILSGPVQFPSNADLLGELTSQFHNIPREIWPNILVIFPTERMASHFLRSLTSTTPATLAPKTLTFDSWIASKSPDTEVSEITLDLLILNIIETCSLKLIRPEDISKIRPILNEFEEFHITQDRVTSALRVAHQETAAESFYEKRIVQIATLYMELLVQLEKRSLLLPIQRLRKSADQFPLLEISKDYEWIFVVGLKNYREFMKPLLYTAASLPNVSLWLTEPFPNLHTLQPLQKLQNCFHSRPHRRWNSSTNGPTIKVVEADSSIHEVEIAYGIAQQYIDKGINPASLSIVATSQYTPLLQRIAKDLPFKTSFGLASKLGHSKTGRWLALLCQWMTSANPVYLEALLGFSDTQSELQTKLVSFTSEFPQQISLNEFKTQFEKVREFSPLNPQENETLKDFSAWFQEAGETHHYKSRDIWQIFLDRILKTETKTTGSPFEGVQIIQSSEAVYIPTLVCIVLGCQQGIFPKSKTKDQFLHGWIKERLGIPGWAPIEAAEDTTYQLLKAQTQNLFLSYPKKNVDAPITRSKYIEEELLLGATFFDPSKELDKKKSDHVEILKKETQAHEYFFKELSARKVQSLLDCPYRFMLQYFGVKEPSTKDRKELAQEGIKLHEIIKVLFHGDDCFDPLTPRSSTEMIVENLAKITTQYNHGELKNITLTQLSTEGWPKLATLLSKMTALPFSSLQEFQVSPSPVVHLHQNVGPTQMIGIVDQLLTIEKNHILIDYKKKNPPLTNKHAQVAFYSWLLSVSKEHALNLENTTAGYWNILDGEWIPIGVGDKTRNWAIQNGLAKKTTPNIQDLVTSLEKQISGIIETIFEKQTITPTPGNHCEYCGYINICQAQ